MYFFSFWFFYLKKILNRKILKKIELYFLTACVQVKPLIKEEVIITDMLLIGKISIDLV